MDQGGCGSCYAFAANQVFADRTNHALGRTSNPIVFSPQAMISCNEGYVGNDGIRFPYGCDGGQAIDMFEWIKEKGAKTCRAEAVTNTHIKDQADDGCAVGCAPYKSGFVADGELCDPPRGHETCWGQHPTCDSMSSCGLTFPQDTYEPHCLQRNSEGYVPVNLIKTHLREEGPVSVVISSSNPTFQKYWNEKFIYTAQDWMPYEGSRSDHAVVIVGWGTNPIEYWIVKNSWTASFGDEGFFYVETGKNVLNIETDVCMIPPAGQIGTRRLSPSEKKFSYYNRSFDKISTSPTGQWFKYDVTSKDVGAVASHFAKRHNSKVVRIVSAQKQVVNGANHRVVFHAMAPDGTINTHSVSAYVTHDGSISKMKESIQPKSLSTLAIAAIATGCVFALVGIAALGFVHFKTRTQPQESVSEAPQIRSRNSFSKQSEGNKKSGTFVVGEGDKIAANEIQVRLEN